MTLFSISILNRGHFSSRMDSFIAKLRSLESEKRFEEKVLRSEEAGLKALEALRNTDDTQFIASDDDDADFLDDQNFVDEFDEVDAEVDEDSKERNRKFFMKKKWMIKANMSLIRLKVQSIG
ncbi:hypothetical protein BpHYR1_042339 [Brachionus plicatilis]|uniref:Uncharacterized protein n=1 Tax=Brachionus plicatilis TaxID=10195 RepID=A0A3M7SUH3_BRAPC|nr:hypothetical protein BpHYR1_042339 [Brachionus plicatilis]